MFARSVERKELLPPTHQNDNYNPVGEEQGYDEVVCRSKHLYDWQSDRENMFWGWR